MKALISNVHAPTRASEATREHAESAKASSGDRTVIYMFICLVLQAQELLQVLEEHGPEYLETWRLPALTWTELQELKAQYEPSATALEGKPGVSLSRPSGKSLITCGQASSAFTESLVCRLLLGSRRHICH